MKTIKISFLALVLLSITSCATAVNGDGRGFITSNSSSPRTSSETSEQESHSDTEDVPTSESGGDISSTPSSTSTDSGAISSEDSSTSTSGDSSDAPVEDSSIVHPSSELRKAVEDPFIPTPGEIRDYFPNNNKYNYCPSSFIEDVNGVRTQHIYYCTNVKAGYVDDFIGYRTATIDGNGNTVWSNEKIVLAPGVTQFSNLGNYESRCTGGSTGATRLPGIPGFDPNAWDSCHNCDPSVIKGQFKYNGTSYSYLMFFLGVKLGADAGYACKKNEIGIAFANNPAGPWIKPGSAVNPIASYVDYGCPATGWGIGQPSCFSIDKKGKVMLLATAEKAALYTISIKYDFSNLTDGNAKSSAVKLQHKERIRTTGLTGNATINNADYAYDPVNHRVIMAKPRAPITSTVANTIDVYFRSDADCEENGDCLLTNNTYGWKLLGTIDNGLTGFYFNHNTGLITDPYGHYDSDKYIGVLYTTANGSTNPELSTYRLHATSFDITKAYFRNY